MDGASATMVALANTTADPVFRVNHQINANRPIMVPTWDNCWPVHIVKNLSFHGDCGNVDPPFFAENLLFSVIRQSHERMKEGTKRREEFRGNYVMSTTKEVTTT